MHLGELGLGNGSATGHYILLHTLDEHLHNLVTGVGYVGQSVQPASTGRPINGSIKELNLEKHRISPSNKGIHQDILG